MSTIDEFMVFIIVIPFVIGLKNYKLFQINLKWLFWFVCYGVINETSGLIFKQMGILSSMMPKRYLYTFITFLFLGLFYHHSLKNFFRKSWILIVTIMYEIYFVINAIFIQDINEYPGVPRAISIIIVIIFSLVYFYKIMVEHKNQKLFANPMIWINTAILIYFAGNLFFNVLFNLIYEYSKEFGKLTFFYLRILNILFYILIAIGFWKVNQEKLKK